MDPNLREIFLSILEQIIKIWIYFDSQHLSQTHLLLKSLPRLVLSLWSSEFLLYITHNFDAPSGSCYRIGDPACLGASLKIRSPTLRFSMLYTYPPYVGAETLSPKENSCLLGRTRIRGCKVFSSRQQPGAWIFSGYSLFQPFQLKNERSIAVSLHVTRNQDLFAYLPLTMKLSCLKHFSGFFLPLTMKMLNGFPIILLLFNQSDGLFCWFAFSLILQLAVFLSLAASISRLVVLLVQPGAGCYCQQKYLRDSTMLFRSMLLILTSENVPLEALAQLLAL